MLAVLAAVPAALPVLAGLADPAAADEGPGVRVTWRNGPANEVDLVVDPTDPLHAVAVAKDYTLGPDPRCGGTNVWGGVYVTRDGGRTWTNGLFPGHPGDDRPSVAAGHACMSDPVVLFAPDGTLYFTGLALGKPEVDDAVPFYEGALVLGVSTDGGDTWTTRYVHDGTSANWADKQMMAVDPRDGALYVGWDLMTTSHTPVLSRSDDGGRTWRTLPLGGPLTAYAPHPGVARDGTLHVSMGTYCTDPRVGLTDRYRTTGCVAVWTSRDGGLTWLPRDVGLRRTAIGPGVSHGYRVPDIPTLAVDRSGASTDGNVVVAWHAYDPLPTRRYHLEVARSVDGGATWQRSQPGFVAGTHQVLPRVAVGPTGVVAVLYYEDSGTTNDPGFVRAALALSRDGALTWEAPRPLSPWFDPSTMLHQAGFVFIGDYVGLDFGPDGRLWAGWADGRDGASDVYVAVLDL